jgi:hypothetical protein
MRKETVRTEWEYTEAWALFQPFAPNIIRLATNCFATGKESNTLNAIARAGRNTGKSLEKILTRLSVKRMPEFLSIWRRAR